MDRPEISVWDQYVSRVSSILMEPILFHDLQVTFIEAIGAYHGRDWVQVPHRHPWYEFNYVSHGALYTRIEDGEFLVQPGCCYLIPPGVVHAHRHCEHAGDDGFCVRWRLEKARLPESGAGQGLADEVTAGFLRTRATAFEYPADRLFRDIETESRYELEASAIRWLMGVYSVLNPQSGGSGDAGGDVRYRSIVSQVLMYLDEYSGADIDVNELADSVGYSYRHLARLFKEKTGATIVEKLNSIRIAKAIHLLENTDMAVGVIASAVGFNTEAYFSTTFSEYTHMSPSAFRSKHRRCHFNEKT